MYLNILLLSLAFLLLAYFTFRVIIKRDYKNHSNLSTTSYFLEIIVFAIHANMFYLFIETKWPFLPQLPENLFIRIISIFIFGVGVTVLLISWFDLGTKPSLGIDKNKLKTDGLYKYSRNPQLVGYGLMLFSFALLFFSWLILIWIIIYLIASYFMILSEEEFLETKYHEEYKVYCEKVPRGIKIF